MAVAEPEVLIGQRAFPESQRIFAGAPFRRLAERVEVGWYGTDTHPLTGAFAVVREGAGLDDLIGEVIRLSWRGRESYVYVLAARGVPTDIALYRRAFFPTLAGLWRVSIPCIVEVV